MALTKSENFKGFPIQAAYHKVASVSLDLIHQTADVIVNVYFNEQERLENPRTPMDKLRFTCYSNNPSGTTFQEFFGTSSDSVIPAESAYLFLKSLPDYADSVDV